MSSIMTNTAATNALATLRTINSDLNKTQERIATGYKINSAKDGAAFYSIATTMRSDIKSLETVDSLLGIGKAKVDTAQVGTDDAIATTQKIKDLLISAKEGSADKTLIQTEIKQLQEQLVTSAKGSSYNGVNMLYKGATGAGAGVQNITASVTRDASNNFGTTSIQVDSAQTLLIDGATAGNGILSKDRTGANSNNYSITGGSNNIALTAATTDSQLSDMIEAVDGALKDMTKSSSTLGSVSNRIESSGEFAKKLKANLEAGVSKLVDADMEKESAMLSALQVRQQLGVQALSIANANSQNILSLFRG
ncbi:flagellin [Agrobacterium salinitolerans]|nr:flagellin [Agrobacterium salinitolerans]